MVKLYPDDISKFLVCVGYVPWDTQRDTPLRPYERITLRWRHNGRDSVSNHHSTVYSDADQRKHQSSTSLAFVRGIHRGPVNSPHKWPVTRKMLPFDDVIMMHHQLTANIRDNDLDILRVQSINVCFSIMDTYRPTRHGPLVMATNLLCQDLNTWVTTRCTSSHGGRYDDINIYNVITKSVEEDKCHHLIILAFRIFQSFKYRIWPMICSSLIVFTICEYIVQTCFINDKFTHFVCELV